MPWEKFQYKQRRIESVLQTEAPNTIPHSSRGSAYTGEPMNTSQTVQPVKRFWGDSSLQVSKWGSGGQIPIKVLGASAEFPLWCSQTVSQPLVNVFNKCILLILRVWIISCWLLASRVHSHPWTGMPRMCCIPLSDAAEATHPCHTCLQQ